MDDLELLTATDKAYDMVFKGPVDFCCLKACYELGIFDILSEAPLTLEQLANATSTVPVRLQKFLKALQEIGLVCQHETTWHLTPFATQFFTVSPDNINLNMKAFVSYLTDTMENYYLHLADVVRGKIDFTSHVPHPPRTRQDSIFYETLHRSNIYFPVQLLLEKAGLANRKHLIDVGGGIGDIASALCKKFPELNVTLINLPSAIELVQENVANHQLSERIKPIAINLYADPYPKGDALMFCRMLYPLGAQFCQMLIQKGYDALEPGGRIILLDMDVSDPKWPNYDYLTHYLSGVGADFAPFEFKHHMVYAEILKNVGFTEIQFDEAYHHVLYQAIKPV
jgi:bacteriochlorophyll C20 methyltransferase